MHGVFWKVALLEISRSPLLAGVARLQYTVYSATKNKILTKFLKTASKIPENIQEMISNGVHYQKFTDLQTTAFILVYF